MNQTGSDSPNFGDTPPVSTASLRERLTPGRAAFDRGAFFEAHELWEEVWRELSGEERTAVQGLIQIAAALHHLQNGRPRPAARLLAKSLEKISRCSPALRARLGVDSIVRAARRPRRGGSSAA